MKIREGLAALWAFQLTVNHTTRWIGHVSTWDKVLSDCDFYVKALACFYSVLSIKAGTYLSFNSGYKSIRTKKNWRPTCGNVTKYGTY